MFKFCVIALLLLATEATAGQPYYYYYSYWDGCSWQYQWVRGYRRDEIEREHAKLDVLERKYDLEIRKNELRRYGVLPQLPALVPHDPDKAGFIFNGRQYKTVTQLKAEPEWQQMITARAQQRQAEQDARAERLKQANETLSKYRYISSVDSARRADQLRAAEILSRPR